MFGMTSKLHELVFSLGSRTKKKKILPPPWYPKFMYRKKFPSCKYQFFSIQIMTCITPTLVSGKKAALLSINLESVWQLAKFLPYRGASFYWLKVIFPLLSGPRVLLLCIPEEVRESDVSSSSIYASLLKHGRLPLTSSPSSLLFVSQWKLDKIWD